MYAKISKALEYILFQLLFYFCNKRPQPKSLEKDTFVSTYRLWSVFPGKSEQEFQTGTLGRILEAGTKEEAREICYSQVFSPYLAKKDFLHIQITCLGVVHPTMGWSLLRQSLINAPWSCLQSNIKEAFSQLRFFFPRYI